MKELDYFKKPSFEGWEDGAYDALEDYQNSLENDLDCFVMSGLILNENIPSYLESLRKAGVKEFAILDDSATMEDIQAYADNGCTFECFCDVNYADGYSKKGYLLSL